jgi:hypothetical protein
MERHAGKLFDDPHLQARRVTRSLGECVPGDTVSGEVLRWTR